MPTADCVKAPAKLCERSVKASGKARTKNLAIHEIGTLFAGSTIGRSARNGNRPNTYILKELADRSERIVRVSKRFDVKIENNNEGDQHE